MAIDWASKSDKDLAADAQKTAWIETLSDAERDKFQIEICKRAGQKFSKEDGTVLYEPPGWRGG